MSESIPLEDELGDVLEKALRQSGFGEEEIAARSGLSVARIRDAIDYRYDLDSGEVRRLAAVLGLNEVGVCALRDAKYPVPEIGGLPFCVWPIRMRHGLGVANAYVVGECDGANALLFDTGPAGDSATRQWPAKVRALQAIFLTHWEPEHAGGLGAALARFGKVPVFGPGRPETAEAIPLGDGEVREFGGFVVQALGTPGHVAAHNCYLVKSARAPSGNPLLISGDMLFAGSAGGAYHCRVQWRAQLDRIFSEIPGQAVVAPGHGPMTTLTHERLFNPFSR